MNASENDLLHDNDASIQQFENSSQNVPLDDDEETTILNQNQQATKIQKNVSLFGRDLGLTSQQFSTIFLLSIDYLLSSSYYSLFAPFLPGEALKKNVSQTQVGIIFGVFELVLIILIPVFGKKLQVFGIRFLFLSGLFLTSGSEILFGFLDACPDGMPFFIMCVMCRVVTAIGVSMGLSYAIVGHFFPNRISSVVALLEVFNGLGTMIGPVVGGYLYQTGGFRLPFFVMGGLMFLVFLLSVFLFPHAESTHPADEATLPLLPLLKIPRMIFTLSMLFVASLSIGFIQPSIEIHLKPLGLTPVQLGLILLCPALLYMFITPPIGYICDKYKRAMPWFMIFGTFGCGLAFCFFGPLSFLQVSLNVWVFLSSFILYGISLAGLIIPVYAELVKVAMVYGGYPNDIRMQGLISAIFGSTWSFGALLGPQIGGYLVDVIGFEKASLGIVICFLSSGFLYTCYFAAKSILPCQRGVVLTVHEIIDPELNETDPLLRST